ncbi:MULTISPECIES: DNA internalization-related competence protein ComEC/Rec2 [Virgibacillus]|uniref:DNA internalization-related competence protein ComEC/Rec2 n=1 Tax=Virgibacillus TaxID=84406 RepID=UPI00098BCE78|nr:MULTISPECIES: DNA internalization-related competence protein ComEC/Rec2 [Virgibacillus]NWO13756.1 DNA internalization-related competence protein ComEC/Rec2 [Virgibacillus sp.]
MSGYWHFIASAALVSMLAKLTNLHSLAFILFMVWISYLFYKKRIAILSVMLSILSLLFFHFYLPELPNHNNISPPNGPTTISGTIISSVEKSPSRLTFTILNKQTDEKIAVAYFSDEEIDYNEAIRYGSACSFTAEWNVPDAATNPGQFDYRMYLLSQEIKFEAILTDIDSLKCISKTGLMQELKGVRHKVLGYIDRRLTNETAGWMRALVLGDDSYVSEDTVELFERWGMSHLLAISGLHVGIVVGLVYFLLIKLNLLTKEWAQWVILVFLPLYAILAGGAPSVLRASLMACMGIILHKTGWKWNVTDVLSLIFLFLLVTDKYMMYQVGFQLSFAVTFALLLSKQILLQSKSRFAQVLYISFIAQIAILPIQFYYFSLFQPASVFVNLLMVPYYSAFVIPIMFFMLILLPFPWISLLDTWFLNIHELAMQIVYWFDEYVYYPMVSGPLPWIIVLTYYVLLFRFMQLWEKGKLKQAFSFAVMLVLVLTLNGLRPYLSPYGTVTMLDIGQGDAFVVELPYRKGTIFIDAGSSFSFQEQAPSDRVHDQIIKPYLYSRGIQQLDAIILTHDDTDHIGSVSYLLEDFAVNTVVVSPFFSTKGLYLLQLTEEVDLATIKGNSKVTIADHLFNVLAPIQDNNDTNGNSIVLHTTLGGREWLFTGDISKKEEKKLVKQYPNLSVDVLKIAHHGSDSSTDKQFLSQLSPEIALISVGRDNLYGHPHQDVMQRLKEQGVTILRTDLHGAVQYRFKGKESYFMIRK